MKKSELRKLFLEKRASLTMDEVSKMSEQIAKQFFDNFDLAAFKTLHTFIPIRKFNEVDTAFMFSRLWFEFPAIVTVAPRIHLSDGLENVKFDANTSLTENRLGIREPADGETIDPQAIDVVIVPLLCFDDRGQRVGYGKGMYDRFLSLCRPDCLKVGVSLFDPVAPVDDISGSDVRLDACLTPKRAYRINEKGAAE